jgi:5-methylcytosine-specific restriction enzyme subunit McrC
MRPRIIPLTEYEPTRFAPSEIPTEVGETLLRHYQNQLEVEFPTPKTDGQWQLRSLGWVGHIPLTPEFHFALQPKVPLANIFRMLEYAYRLEFKILAGLIDCESLVEFYERLAHILARRVLDRGRKGFYRAYLGQTEHLPYIRGQLDVRQSIQAPAQIKLKCHYEEHTADIADNQILAWTLFRIAHSGMCTERVLPTIRRAYRSLQGLVTLTPHPPKACLGRLYNRLNDDYQPLHALCRFFLEQSGPGHQVGDRTMLPFLVNMARLYELFVAEWLKAHLPPGFNLKVQEKVNIGEANVLYFDIDLVLYETETGAVRCVLDTKYKAPLTPAQDDIFQVVTYAEAKGCREAILIYPTSLPRPLDEVIGNIRVRSLTFSLDRDLEQAGQTFMRELMHHRQPSKQAFDVSG